MRLDASGARVLRSQPSSLQAQSLVGRLQCLRRAREEDVSTWKLPGDSCGAHESHRALTSSLPTIQEGKVRGFKRERRDDSALLVIRPCGCVASLLCPVRQGMQVQRAEDLEVSVSSS